MGTALTCTTQRTEMSVYSIASLSAGLSLLRSAAMAEFTDFNLVASIDFEHPAFMRFMTFTAETTEDLTVSVFSASDPGKVKVIKNVTSAFSDPTYADTMLTEVIYDNFIWPNELLEISDGVFCPEKTKKICGGEMCSILTLGDGFLVPGHQTGSVYLQPIHLSGQPTIPPVKIAEEEEFWYYHSAQWADIDGDGLLDIVTGRAWTNNIGQTKGELVWFKQPTTADEITSLWKMGTLQEGPDILTMVDSSVDGVVLVYAPEFWGEKLSLTTIKVGETPEVVSYDILDAESGAGYCVFMADVDGDGVDELVVNNHEHTDGAIFAYELPQFKSADVNHIKEQLDIWRASAGLERHIISTGYEVIKKIPSEAAPGLIYPYIPLSSKNEENPRPWWLVAGDGSHAVHIVYPIHEEGNPYAYTTEKIIDIDGTVGSLALLPLADGSLGVVAPNYDDSKLYFFKFFSNA